MVATKRLELHFVFSFEVIDGCNMLLIAASLVAAKPLTTDEIHANFGEACRAIAFTNVDRLRDAPLTREL